MSAPLAEVIRKRHYCRLAPIAVQCSHAECMAETWSAHLAVVFDAEDARWSEAESGHPGLLSLHVIDNLRAVLGLADQSSAGVYPPAHGGGAAVESASASRGDGATAGPVPPAPPDQTDEETT